ncbi:MAG: CAP domain-containing protein [Polyangiaceae bacterium]
MAQRSWLGSLIALICFGCAASSLQVANAPREQIAVPDEVAMYSTDATPDGVVGGEGSERLAADVAAAVAQRGAQASPDGALAATASWILREVNQGHQLSQSATEAQARRFGFAGVIVSMAGFGLDAQNANAWRKALEQVPPNLPVTRYGISVAQSGRSASVVFGAVELSVEPFARHLSLNESVSLRGEVAPRYSFAHVYLTKADGTVEEKRLPTRKLDVTFTFPSAGKYNLEVMGDGKTGPVIVFNVPIYVATPDDVSAGSSGHVTSPGAGEARMFELLNQARKTAGLSALEADDELRELARAHSDDMAEHHFFGHVSPTTGTTDDRYRRSGVVVAAFGENVAEADSAETAYDGLMDSPGHRANMLGALYTHVGIAAVSTDSEQLAFTLIFGRRANPATMPRSSAQVEAAFLALRAKKGLSKPVADPIYRVAVEAGVAAYVDAATPTPEVAVRAQNAALSKEVQRARSSRAGGCSFVTELLELEQLERTPILSAPEIRRYALATRVRQDEHGPRLAVMMLLEGPPCR